MSLFGSISFGSHTGSAPAPFDALDGPRLAGPEGSHPLHSVGLDELVKPVSGNEVSGSITLAHPVRVGEGIDGTIKLVAGRRIESRSAYLRLVGLRLDEVRRSVDHRNAKGEVISHEEWVEVSGNLFVHDAFTEPAIPATLEAGETWEGTCSVPAPRLGPPSAHLGESLIAWALEVHWDVAMGGDHFIAIPVTVAQHPDLLAAGVGVQGGVSMMSGVSIKGAEIGVTSKLPAPNGAPMTVRVAWPGAPHGQRARIELHRRTNAPNGVEGILATVDVDPSQLASGEATADLLVPAGSPPSFDGAGLQLGYIIRVLVDQRFRPDAAIERPVAIL